MRLTLLVGVDARKGVGGPHVRLQAGSWRFDCHGHKDSELFLITSESRLAVKHDQEFVLGKADVVRIEGSGTDQNLTINVRKVA